ncbi:MAG: RraA family protein [Opitutaceae bacterium]|nr:RraA family protein [Opitutaceae bacterium]
MTEWTNDEALFSVIRRELYTPVVGDVLDVAGRYNQFLPAPVQPLRDDMQLVGRAMPVVMIDVDGPQAKPFGLLTEALDDLRPGEVYVAGGGAMRCAYWGELLTAAARTRRAAGAVIDGYHRDTPKVLEQGWPVFSRGRYAQDSAVRTAVADFRCALEIAGVRIEPGDLIFGDLDGVVVVPRALENDIIAQALEKARGEKRVRRAIESGMSATEAFRTFGIL